MQTTLGLPDGLPGIVMAIPTCTRWWPTACSTSCPKSASRRWRSWSGRGSSRFWPQKGLLPLARAQMLRAWTHSGFTVHRSRRVLPDERADLGAAAQDMIRSPCAVEKMQVHEANGSSPDGSVYHSGRHPTLPRTVEVVTLCDVIAAITQPMSDKSVHLVRY